MRRGDSCNAILCGRGEWRDPPWRREAAPVLVPVRVPVLVPVPALVPSRSRTPGPVPVRFRSGIRFRLAVPVQYSYSVARTQAIWHVHVVCSLARLSR